MTPLNIKYLIAAIGIVVVGGVVVDLFGAKTEPVSETPVTQVQDKQSPSATISEDNTDSSLTYGGTYEIYTPEKIAWAKDGEVILFFRAGWCPTCKAVDADIRKNTATIPKNVTILDVNYDTETSLKQKYGVTYQHTFVQVDASGNQITKWSGSPTLAALLANVQ